MVAASTSTYAILGLLSLSPMSGYEVAQATEHSIAHFWPLSKTHVYSELARLEKLEWVEAKEITQEKAPDKRVFHITPPGEQALDQWLVSSPLPAEVHRLPILIKLFIGHRIPRDKLLEMLEEYRQESEDYRRGMQDIVDALKGIPKAAYPRATALLGLRMAEGTVRWIDEVEKALPKQRVTIDPHGSEAVKAKELFDTAPPASLPRPRAGRRKPNA